MCSDKIDGYGCECKEGNESIPGRRPAVIRTRYLADKTKCCLGTTPTIEGWTCDPIYRGRQAAACEQVLKTYCDNPNNSSTSTCEEINGISGSKIENVNVGSGNGNVGNESETGSNNISGNESVGNGGSNNISGNESGNESENEPAKSKPEMSQGMIYTIIGGSVGFLLILIIIIIVMLAGGKKKKV